MILTRLSRAVVFRLMRPRNRFGRLVGLDRAMALLLLMALILIRIWDPMPIEELRLKVFDAYQVLRPRQSTARPVAILDIDEASLRTLGQWPWSRRRMAEIVLKLKAMGAVAIGFDIVFAEPDRLSPRQFSEAQADLDPHLRVALEALPSNDDAFASAIRQARVVLGRTALSEPLGPVASLPSTGFATVGPNVWPYLLHYPGLLANIPVLEAVAKGRGLFTIAPERDGIVRRVPMVVGAQNTMQPSLTLDIVRVLTGAGAVLIRSSTSASASIRASASSATWGPIFASTIRCSAIR